MQRPNHLLSFWLLCYLSLTLLAHDGLREQIEELTRQLRLKPHDAQLYLRRGELHRLQRAWQSALADYAQAARLDPALREVAFARGRMWLAAGKPQLARAELDRFLAARPAHAEAWLMRARSLVMLKHFAAAARDYTQAINLLPQPDHYIERAQAQTQAGQYAEALRGLDEGLLCLGQLVVLQTLAIDLEVKRKRWNEALARLDQLAARTPRRESWLVKRGEILLLAGRKLEAKQAFSAALQSLDELPPAQRRTRAMLELERKAQTQR
jgi:tetratricopeptide (TPR) repeat protein